MKNNQLLMSLINEVASKYPVPERKLQKVQFGSVDGSRGKDTMSPPIELDDHYHWMRDDSRTNQSVLEHLKQENSYTEHVMKDTDSLQKEICRGLLYGETEDSIFRFLKKIQGSRNIRENILTYYNPFV